MGVESYGGLVWPWPFAGVVCGRLVGDRAGVHAHAPTRRHGRAGESGAQPATSSPARSPSLQASTGARDDPRTVPMMVATPKTAQPNRSEEHTSELPSLST